MIKLQNTPKTAAIIPARDEARAIGQVVTALRELRTDSGERVIDTILVCDNGSVDRTTEVARCAGATVVYQPEAGYGLACLTAIDQLSNPDLLLFIDGDNAFSADQAIPLINAVIQGADLAIGSRVLGNMASGALTLPQRAGNRLASFLIRLLWGTHVTDLGPFRAISWQAYQRLNMRDRRFGWTVEMQVKAIQLGMRVEEYPVDTRRRIGRSKISGTLKGTLGAAHGILSTIGRLWWQERRQRRRADAVAALSSAGDQR